MKVKNLIGQTFNLLTVIERAENTARGVARWLCLCKCGNKKIIMGTHLTRGEIKSCGCLRQGNKTHGLISHPLYSRWSGIIQRCTNPNVRHYPYYGGRGISVCSEWLDSSESFILYIEKTFPNWEEFLEKRYQIDRINNDGNYEPGNLRFVSQKENNNNKRPRSKKGLDPYNHQGPNIKSLVGEVFGKLKVIEFLRTEKGRSVWLCNCECGNNCEASSNVLTPGHKSSCGCLKIEVSKNRETHGMRNSPIYATWTRMKKRAASGNIELYSGWLDFTEFVSWSKSQNWEKGQLLRFKDVLKGYYPDNCYYTSSRKQQPLSSGGDLHDYRQ